LDGDVTADDEEEKEEVKEEEKEEEKPIKREDEEEEEEVDEGIGSNGLVRSRINLRGEEDAGSAEVSIAERAPSPDTPCNATYVLADTSSSTRALADDSELTGVSCHQTSHIHSTAHNPYKQPQQITNDRVAPDVSEFNHQQT
jgi:hypothetical protein